MGKLSEFDRAFSSVNQDRGKIYGHPFYGFTRAQCLMDCIKDCPNPQVRHALMMICVKMARLAVAPDHLDSWIDIAGYARTGVMCLEPL